MSRRPKHDSRPIDVAAALAEYALTRKQIPPRDALIERFGMSRAAACRWRVWMRDRYPKLQDVPA